MHDILCKLFIQQYIKREPCMCWNIIIAHKFCNVVRCRYVFILKWGIVDTLVMKILVVMVIKALRIVNTLVVC